MSDELRLDDDGAGDGERRQWQLPELITLVLSAVVVLGFAGIAILLEVQAPAPATAELTVTLDDPLTGAGAGYQVPFTVTNAGNAGASQVAVRIELAHAGDAPETVDVVLDVVSAGSSESGVALFANDPASGELSAGVASFLQP